ncbi:MFS transporter [Brevibacillus dissolubilis]|uniref:MFS transporter n=1 Tax=Brevibacillus dissolubilis TaxID=1844116 RepID=UPI0011161BD3|nr:MFS transporter [Brevibacillus dissolubilis]
MHVPLWKQRPFRLLWSAQVASNVGDQFYYIALLWFLLHETNDPSVLSMVSIPEMLAGLIFYMIGGVLADRMSPRQMMMSSDLARVVIAALVGLVVMLKVTSFPFFLAMQFAIGIFSTLFYPSRAVALRSVIAQEQLGKANAVLDTTFRTIRILAPMLIGLMASLMPISYMFFTTGVCYLFSAFFVYSLRSYLYQEKMPRAGALSPKEYMSDIKDALTEVAGKRLLYYILLFGNIGFIVWQICWNVGFPVLAKQLDADNPQMLATLFGCYGVGNLIGSLLMTRLRYQNHLLVILVGWVFVALGFLLIGLCDSMEMIVFASAIIAGFGGPLIGIPLVTAIQTKIEMQNTGKVFSLNMFGFTLFCIVSNSMGAAGLSTLPVATIFMIAGVFLFVMILAGYVLGRTEWKKVQSEAATVQGS